MQQLANQNRRRQSNKPIKTQSKARENVWERVPIGSAEHVVREL